MRAEEWRRTNKLGRRVKDAEREIELEGLLAPFWVCFVGYSDLCGTLDEGPSAQTVQLQKLSIIYHAVSQIGRYETSELLQQSLKS